MTAGDNFALNDECINRNCKMHWWFVGHVINNVGYSDMKRKENESAAVVVLL